MTFSAGRGHEGFDEHLGPPTYQGSLRAATEAARPLGRSRSPEHKLLEASGPQPLPAEIGTTYEFGVLSIKPGGAQLARCGREFPCKLHDNGDAGPPFRGAPTHTAVPVEKNNPRDGAAP